MAVPLGMYLETLSVGALMFLGVQFVTAAFATALAMTALTATLLYWTRQGPAARPARLARLARLARPARLPRFSARPLQWHEWALIAALGEKLPFSVWQLARMHTYFLDALTHSSRRS